MISPSRRRTLLMPLLILAVGCAVAWWSSATKTRTRVAIEGDTARLVQDVCAGKPVTLPVDASSPVLHDLLLAELRRVCVEVGTVDAIVVDVQEGDANNPGGQADQATHTAMIRLRDSERVLLVLRVRRSDQGAMTIAGYVTPPGK